LSGVRAVVTERLGVISLREFPMKVGVAPHGAAA